MSNTPLTLDRADISTLLQAVRGEREFNPFADGEYVERLHRMEAKLLAALRRIRDNEDRIAEKRRQRVRGVSRAR